MNNFCKHCGTGLPSDSKFCPKCGESVIASINQVEVQLNKSPEVVSGGPKKKKSGCLKFFLIIIGVFLTLIFIGIASLFIGDDEPVESQVYFEDVLDKTTGLEFYNMEEIPCLETEDGFNEIFIPYITRGIASRYREAELFGEVILSVDYMTNHSYEEWRLAMGVYADNWEEVELLTESYGLLLESLELENASAEGEQDIVSIEFFIEAHASEAVDKKELEMLLQRAHDHKLDPVKLLTANMNISAKKAKELGRLYWNKDTNQKISEKWSSEADLAEFSENILKVTHFIGKGAAVYASTSGFGALSLLKQVAVVVTSGDTVLSMGEDGVAYLFGEGVGKKTFITDIRSLTKGVAPFMSLLTFDASNLAKDSGVIKNISEAMNVFKFSFDAGKGLTEGKILSIDISGEDVEAKVHKDRDELESSLLAKGLKVDKNELSDNEMSELEKDAAWLDESDLVKKRYLDKKSHEITKDKSEVDEKIKDLPEEMKELHKVSDPSNDAKEDEEISDEDQIKKDTMESEKVEEDAVGFLVACAKKMGYDLDMDSAYSVGGLLEKIAEGGYEDIAKQYGMEEGLKEIYADFNREKERKKEEVEELKDSIMIHIEKDPLANSVWQKLEEVNSVDDTVVDEIMSDIIWTMGSKLNPKISAKELEAIFMERSPKLYKEFEALISAGN